MPPFPDTHAISNRAACWMASKNGGRRKATLRRLEAEYVRHSRSCFGGCSRLPRRSPAQPIEMRFINGTRFPSVLSSFSYTADLCRSFIKEFQGIGALY